MNNPSKDVRGSSNENDFGSFVEDVLRDELQEIDKYRRIALHSLLG